MAKPRLAVVNDRPAKAPAVPAPPSTLGRAGAAEWRRVVAALIAAGRMSDERRSLVLAYCEAIEGAAECAKILKKQGRFISRANADTKLHPAVKQQLAYMQQSLRLAERLGIVTAPSQRDRKVPDDNGSPTSLVD